MTLKTSVLTLIFSMISIVAWTQTAEDFLNAFMGELQSKNYEKGIRYLDTLIKEYPNYEKIHTAYLNRASAKSLTNDPEGAIEDYTAAFKLNPEYAEAVRLRGCLKKKMGEFEEALIDFDLAIKTDSNLAQVYVNKALLLDSLGQLEEACQNYEKALELGITDVAGIIISSCDSNSMALKKYTYKILVDKTEDDTYGYTKDNPIKVGHGPRGQRAYLALLRDAQGYPVEYERLGNVGYYASENGLFGMAAIDSYRIYYRNSKGKKKDTTLYLSFYDYDPPKIPVGFYSIQDFDDKN